MASSIAAITMPRSIDFSRATASAICSNSSLLALTAAMALVSSRGIEFVSKQPFCGEAMFLGILRGVLLVRLQFRLRFVAFRWVIFSCMRRGRRLQSEALAPLALRGLVAPHRFRDQFVGQHEPCLGDILHLQDDAGILVRLCVIAI